MLGYAQRAEALGFDSVWVPDHVFFERRPGVLVLPDAAAARDVVDMLAADQSGRTPEDVRNRFVIGTPDEVAAGLQRIVDWGATHLICSLGAEMFTLWSDSTLELFAHEVLPRVRKMQVTA
jgi:alkanesulfonate monooxygenase SsuD/methylene tetrahydromethanopterin reductase-like flavin-dependent oxidoreductase (luciferase family)